MTEEQIARAAQFLAGMRPNDFNHVSRDAQLLAYEDEIRAQLQVQAALRMAGVLTERRMNVEPTFGSPS